MCGIFGIITSGRSQPVASEITADGLRRLQHRGQRAAGVVSHDGRRFHEKRGLGEVRDVFSGFDFRQNLPGDAAIGHVRYPTHGDPDSLKSIQPFVVNGDFDISVAHNGQLTNDAELRAKLAASGVSLDSPSDSILFPYLAIASEQGLEANRIMDSFRQAEGSFALLALTAEALYVAADPWSIRPVCCGSFDGGIMAASETCALDLFGIAPDKMHFLEPGTMLQVERHSLKCHLYRFAQADRRYQCIFEWIYFSRPDSRLWGKSVSEVRKELGRALARRHPIKADVVIAVPDSSNQSALEFARALGLPFDFGLVRGHSIGRTFIEASDQARISSVRIKLNVDPAVVAGKSVVVVDDSIVRSHTSTKVVKMIRTAGAREVHLRIASPPVICPCHYGIDTPTIGELIAAGHTIEEVRRIVGADSLGFLTKEDIGQAVGDPQCREHCTACFTGQLPNLSRKK